jgi:hypothetical protein
MPSGDCAEDYCVDTRSSVLGSCNLPQGEEGGPCVYQHAWPERYVSILAPHRSSSLPAHGFNPRPEAWRYLAHRGVSILAPHRCGARRKHHPNPDMCAYENTGDAKTATNPETCHGFTTNAANTLELLANFLPKTRILLAKPA